MKVIYSDEPCDVHSELFGVFLAGPTPRSSDVPSWRPEALDALRHYGFDGVVYVPERRNGWAKADYDDQIQWEWEALERCDCSGDVAGRICFWIPRNLETMHGFTTNVEFGLYVRSPNILYGRPDSAPGCKYLDWLFRRFHGDQVNIYNDFEWLMADVVSESIYWKSTPKKEHWR